MNEQELSEIETRLAAISPGKWFASLKHSDAYIRPNPVVKRISVDGDGAPITRNVATAGHGNASSQKDPRWIQQARDAEFIAHSKEDITRLLAEVRRLRAIVDVTAV